MSYHLALFVAHFQFWWDLENLIFGGKERVMILAEVYNKFVALGIEANHIGSRILVPVGLMLPSGREDASVCDVLKEVVDDEPMMEISKYWLDGRTGVTLQMAMTTDLKGKEINPENLKIMNQIGFGKFLTHESEFGGILVPSGKLTVVHKANGKELLRTMNKELLEKMVGVMACELCGVFAPYRFFDKKRLGQF